MSVACRPANLLIECRIWLNPKRSSMGSGRTGIGSPLCSAGTPAASCGSTICKSEVRLIPSRIRKVLSTMAGHQVRALLMGGQACVFYGAAEFSRDTDLLILADAANLARLEAALHNLRAECIAVPPLTLDYLQRGHAVHFRCHHPEHPAERYSRLPVRSTGPPEGQSPCAQNPPSPAPPPGGPACST